MSVPASSSSSTRQERAYTIDEDESQWPPNPYQAQAEAQVRAGAWPGTSLLMKASSYPNMADLKDQQLARPAQLPSRQPTMLSPLEPAADTASNESALSRQVASAQETQSAQTRSANSDNVGDDDETSTGASPSTNWNGTPWRFLFEFRASDRTTKQGAGGSSGSTHIFQDFDSTDEGDVDADLPETPASTTEATEGDDSSTPCSASHQSQVARKLSHQCVPRNTNIAQDVGDQIERNDITTLMLRNIPNLYTRSMLMEELDLLGFRYEYDFIYLPIDKSTQWNVGYAFVNFTDSQAAKRCMDAMTSYTFTRYEHGSGKVAQVSIAHMQGLEKNVKYYSNTAVQCARIQSHRPLNLGNTPTERNTSGRKPRQRRRRHKPGSSDDSGSVRLLADEGVLEQRVLPEEEENEFVSIDGDSICTAESTPSQSSRRQQYQTLDFEEQRNRQPRSNEQSSSSSFQRPPVNFPGASADMWRRRPAENSASRGVDAFSRAGSSDLWYNMSKGISGFGANALGAPSPTSDFTEDARHMSVDGSRDR